MQEYKLKSKDGNYYEFFRNARAAKPTILHFQVYAIKLCNSIMFFILIIPKICCVQLRNLVWATSKDDVYFSSHYSIMHWSSLSQNLTEVLNFSGNVAPTEVTFVYFIKFMIFIVNLIKAMLG